METCMDCLCALKRFVWWDARELTWCLKSISNGTVCISNSCSCSWQFTLTFCCKYFAWSLLSAKMKIWQWGGRESLLWPKYFFSTLCTEFILSDFCFQRCDLVPLDACMLGWSSNFKAQFSWSVLNIYFIYIWVA